MPLQQKVKNPKRIINNNYKPQIIAMSNYKSDNSLKQNNANRNNKPIQYCARKCSIKPAINTFRVNITENNRVIQINQKTDKAANKESFVVFFHFQFVMETKNFDF